MDIRIQQFERLWATRARLPRLTTFADVRPSLPRGFPGLAPLGLGSPPPRPNFPLIRMTNEPIDDLGPFPVFEPLMRQTNRHELLSPNRLREWWEADAPTRARIMREDGIE